VVVFLIPCILQEVLLEADVGNLPMENLTTWSRSLLSIARPIMGAKIMAETERTSAYIDNGNSVPVKMEARNSTAPNSKEREFHVERK